MAYNYNQHGNPQQMAGMGFQPPPQGFVPQNVHPGHHMPAGTPGYPPTGTPGYPPTGTPGYSPAGTPGYPPASTPGYPPASTPGYPPAGTPGYPPASTPGYPPASTPGYPPASTPGYPPAGTPGYPHAGNPGYPHAGASGYPPTGTPGYPPAGNPGYPPSGTPGYPPASAPGYPNAGASGYPPGGTPGHPAPAGGMNACGYVEIPSIKAGQRIDADSDAKILRKAMKGIGTDESAIISVLGRRTNSQRQAIASAFKTMFGKDLMKELKSELSGNFEDAILALMTPRLEYMATGLHKAMDGVGTREQTLLDILCTSDAREIREINSIYTKKFNKPLESDLRGDTSGNFKRLLVSLSSAGRKDDVYGDRAMATLDAQCLYKAGEKRMGTDESTFNSILTSRSFPQIRLICEEYQRITGHSLEKAIKKEFSGDIEDGLLAIIKSAKNRAAYFAERIYQSVAGLGTKDKDLIFIVVTRAEIDMENIKQEYLKLYKKPLSSAISGDTSGDYKRILLTLIGDR